MTSVSSEGDRNNLFIRFGEKQEISLQDIEKGLQKGGKLFDRAVSWIKLSLLGEAKISEKSVRELLGKLSMKELSTIQREGFEALSKLAQGEIDKRLEPIDRKMKFLTPEVLWKQVAMKLATIHSDRAHWSPDLEKKFAQCQKRFMGADDAAIFAAVTKSIIDEIQAGKGEKNGSARVWAKYFQPDLIGEFRLKSSEAAPTLISKPQVQERKFTIFSPKHTIVEGFFQRLDPVWQKAGERMGKDTVIKLLIAYSQGPEKGNAALKEYMEKGSISVSQESLFSLCVMTIKAKAFGLDKMLEKAKTNFAQAHQGRIEKKQRDKLLTEIGSKLQVATKGIENFKKQLEVAASRIAKEQLVPYIAKLVNQKELLKIELNEARTSDIGSKLQIVTKGIDHFKKQFDDLADKIRDLVIQEKQKADSGEDTTDIKRGLAASRIAKEQLVPCIAKLVNHKEQLKIELNEARNAVDIGFSFPDYLSKIADAHEYIQNPQTRLEDFFTRSLVGQFITGIEEKSLISELAVRKKRTLENYEPDTTRSTKEGPFPYSTKERTGISAVDKEREQKQMQTEIWESLKGGHASVEAAKDGIKRVVEYHEKVREKLLTDSDYIITNTHTDSSVIPAGNRGFNASVTHSTGTLTTQEDCHAMGKVTYDGREVPFFAICDGHGGAETARFISDKMGEIIDKTLSGPGELAEKLPLLGVVAESMVLKERKSAPERLQKARTDFTQMVSKAPKIDISDTHIQEIFKFTNTDGNINEDSLKQALNELGNKYNKLTSFKALQGIEPLRAPEHVDVKELKRLLVSQYNMLKNAESLVTDPTWELMRQVCRLPGEEGMSPELGNVKKFLQLPRETSKNATSLVLNYFNEAIHSGAMEKAGTTLTLALVVNNEVYTINVGDARTLLQDSNGKVTQLTRDATPKGEQVSIRKRGGYVSGEEGRVSGALGAARSIGDTRITGVSPRAKVTMMPLPEEGGRLILGCDGLFEQMSSDKVGELANNDAFGTLEEKSQALALGAVAMGSRDNVSAMVVDIPPVKQ